MKSLLLVASLSENILNSPVVVRNGFYKFGHLSKYIKMLLLREILNFNRKFENKV